MRGLLRGGVGLVLGALLLGACGGDDDDPGASAGQTDDSATSQPEAEPSDGDSDDTGAGSGDASEFCADIEAAEEQFSSTLEDPTFEDPQAAVESLEEAVGAMRAVEPPSEIAGDWAVLVDFLDAIASTALEIDPSNPEDAAAQMEELGRLLDDQSGELEAAGTNIDDFLSEECGISLD